MAEVPDYLVDPKFVAEMEAWRGDAHGALMLAMGRLCKQMDADVGLLMLGGVDISRMELRSYAAEPLRRSLAVDGNVIRDYTFVIDEPRGAEVLDRYQLYWTAEMPDHVRHMAEAIIEWSNTAANLGEERLPVVVNTPIGPVEVRRR